MYMIPRVINISTIRFDWDDANREKNWKKHKVTTVECEETLFNRPRMIVRDERHSSSEQRYSLLGFTNAGRILNVVFTLRGDAVRIISARDQNRKERVMFEQYVKSLSNKAQTMT